MDSKDGDDSGAAEVQQLVYSGACHLLNYAFSEVVRRRCPNPVEEMAAILTSQSVTLRPAELLRFVKDVRCGGSPVLQAMVAGVLRRSSPDPLTPSDDSFGLYVEACATAAAKMTPEDLAGGAAAGGAGAGDDGGAAAAAAEAGTPLLQLTSLMQRGKAALQQHRPAVAAPPAPPAQGLGVPAVAPAATGPPTLASTGSQTAQATQAAVCRVQFLAEAGPLLRLEDDTLPLLVRQLYWLFEDALHWQWSLDLVCFGADSLRSAGLALMRRGGGGSHVRAVEAPLQFQGSSEHHYVVLLDGSHSVHAAAAGLLLRELAGDKPHAGAVLRDADASSSSSPDTAGAGATTSNDESRAAAGLMRKLVTSPAAAACAGDGWCRMAAYRGSVLRSLAANAPFRAKRCYGVELAARVAATQDRAGGGGGGGGGVGGSEKPRKGGGCVLATVAVPHLVPRDAFAYAESGGVPRPDLSFEEWAGVAAAVAADGRRKESFAKQYPAFATEAAFNEALAALLPSDDAEATGERAEEEGEERRHDVTPPASAAGSAVGDDGADASAGCVEEEGSRGEGVPSGTPTLSVSPSPLPIPPPE